MEKERENLDDGLEITDNSRKEKTRLTASPPTGGSGLCITPCVKKRRVPLLGGLGLFVFQIQFRRRPSERGETLSRIMIKTYNLLI